MYLGWGRCIHCVMFVGLGLEPYFDVNVRASNKRGFIWCFRLFWATAYGPILMYLGWARCMYTLCGVCRALAPLPVKAKTCYLGISKLSVFVQIPSTNRW